MNKGPISAQARAYRLSRHVDADVSDPKWRDRAACRGEDTALFFAEEATVEARRTRARARDICFGCPVQGDCLLWAVAADAHGIWGGTTREERLAVRKKRKGAAA
jgi:WhiB family redox-sensing transcriptional regulator